MYVYSYMPVSKYRRGKLCYNIVAVCYTERLENTLVIGFCKGSVSHTGTSEKISFNVLFGKIILQVNGTKNGKGGTEGMSSDNDFALLLGYKRMYFVPYGFVAFQKSAVYTNVAYTIAVGDGFFGKTEVVYPVEPGIRAPE